MFSISNLCLAYLPSALLRYTRSLSGGSSKQSEAKHKTSYSFRSEVAFIYFKASESGAAGRFIKRSFLGGLASWKFHLKIYLFLTSPRSLLFKNIVLVVTYYSFCISLS